MKVYLINPPSPFLLDDKSNVPLGLMYVHAFLKSRGVDVDVVDLAGLKEKQWKIPEDGDIYGISATTPQLPTAVNISYQISRANNIVVLGGVHGTCEPALSLRTGAFDAVVSGEGEQTMFDLALGMPVERAEGVTYWGNDMSIRANKPLPPQHTIDIYPHPRLDAIDISSYHCGVFTTEDGDTISGIPIITARGCPHNCAFCCSPKLYKRKVRFHSAGYMDEWIGYLRDHGFKDYYIVDDTLLLKKSRLADICTILRNAGSTWRCCIRGDAATEDKLQMMYDSGCRQVDIGVESGSQKILDLVNKGEKVEDNTRAIDLCHEIGIKVKACIIVGLPGEEQEDVDLTAKLIHDHKPDSVTLCTFVPFPGCAIERNPDKYGYDLDRHTAYDQYFCCWAGDAPNETHPAKQEKTERFRQQLLSAVGDRTTLSALKRRKA